MKFLRLVAIVLVTVVLVSVHADVEDKEKVREWFCKKVSESGFAQKTLDCMDKTHTDENKKGWEMCKMEVQDEKIDNIAFIMKMCEDHTLADMAVECYKKSEHFPTMETLQSYTECIMHLM